MSYRVIPKDGGTDIHITALSREELFRDAIAGTLEAVYGRAPETPLTSEGQVVPLQAAGEDDTQLLQGLLTGCLEESSHDTRLLPASWMSFDSARVTANLRRSNAPGEPRRLDLRGVAHRASSFEAQLSFEQAPAHH